MFVYQRDPNDNLRNETHSTSDAAAKWLAGGTDGFGGSKDWKCKENEGGKSQHVGVQVCRAELDELAIYVYDTLQSASLLCCLEQ